MCDYLPLVLSLACEEELRSTNLYDWLHGAERCQRVVRDLEAINTDMPNTGSEVGGV
jgi:hypothetical protein